MNYDLLLRGGRVIDPAQNLDGILRRRGEGRPHRGGRATSIAPSSAKETVDVSGKLVLPGLIDTHAHVFEYVTGRFGLDADLCGVHSGVTTLVDQGGPSCMTLPGVPRVRRQRRRRAACWRSSRPTSSAAWKGHYYPSLYKPDCVDVDATVRAARENRDLVKGVKAHAEIGGFARWGVEVMRLAARDRRDARPAALHPLRPALAAARDGRRTRRSRHHPRRRWSTLLKPGDILAHPFTRHPGGFVDRDGKVHPIVREALARGLKTDVGHGSHFSFKMARIVLDAGIVPDTLGADMHGYNTRCPKPRGTPDEHPDKEHMFFGADAVLAGLGDDRDAGARPDARAGRADGDQPPRRRCSAWRTRSARCARRRAPTSSVLDDERGRCVLQDNEKHRRCVAERMLRPASACAPASASTRTPPILPRRWPPDAA